MTRVEVRDVRNYALRGVSTAFPSGRLSVILGPNGAGKTTLVKVIAGLVKYEGSVLFNGIPVDNVPPYERGVSYVPQGVSLFINMSVWENVAFGLKARGAPENLIRDRVRELLSMLKLEHLANAYPATLSGGEARKVALARALAVNPRVLLLDEPFTGLDVEAKAVVEQEIMSLIRRLRKTVVLVTHDVGRGLGVADAVTILWRGRVAYSGPPHHLADTHLPEDIGFWIGTVLKGVEVGLDGGLAYAVIDGVKVPVSCVGEGLGEGTHAIVIPVGNVRVCRRSPLTGVVERVWRDVRGFKAVVRAGDVRLRLLTPFNLREGEHVGLRISGAVLLGTAAPRSCSSMP